MIRFLINNTTISKIFQFTKIYGLDEDIICCDEE